MDQASASVMAATRRWLTIIDVRNRNWRARAGSAAIARKSSRLRRRVKLGRHRSPLPAVEIEQIVGRVIIDHARQLLGQIGGILDAAVQAHTADRVVDVGGIARQQHAAFAEGFRHALMRHVKIAMNDLVRP